MCFGCESAHSKASKRYTSLDTSGEYAASSTTSDLSEEMNNDIGGISSAAIIMNDDGVDIIKRNQIPKPDLFANRVQPPPNIEVIDESLIIADFVYGGSSGSIATTPSTNSPSIDPAEKSG